MTEPTTTPVEPAADAVGEAGGTRGARKTREGYVVSTKMAKTIVVEVEDRVRHPRYAKTIRRTNKLHAHDEATTAGVGDRVLLMETRPMSATKRWRLVSVLERAQ